MNQPGQPPPAQPPGGPYGGRQGPENPYGGPAQPGGPYGGRPRPDSPYGRPQTPTGPYGGQPRPDSPYRGPAHPGGPYGGPPGSGGPYGGPPGSGGPYGGPPGPGGPYGPPGGGGPYGGPGASGPSDFPPPKRPPRTGLIVLLTVVGVVLLLVGAGAVIAVVAKSSGVKSPLPEPSPTGAWQVGQCVTPAVTTANEKYTRVACRDQRAGAKIIKIVPRPPIGEESQCPDESDASVTVGLFELGSQEQGACLRNLKPPHPGDAGQGGGNLRAGDCIESPFFLINEVACNSTKVWGTVLSRTQSDDDCPKATEEVVKLKKSTRPVLCVDKK